LRNLRLGFGTEKGLGGQFRASPSVQRWGASQGSRKKEDLKESFQVRFKNTKKKKKKKKVRKKRGSSTLGAIH